MLCYIETWMIKGGYTASRRLVSDAASFQSSDVHESIISVQIRSSWMRAAWDSFGDLSDGHDLSERLVLC